MGTVRHMLIKLQPIYYYTLFLLFKNNYSLYLGAVDTLITGVIVDSFITGYELELL